MNGSIRRWVGLAGCGVVAACSTNHTASNDAGRDAPAFPDARYDAKLVAVDGSVAAGHFDVLTQHNDMARTGQNLSEYVLTTSNVNSTTFGKLQTLPVDGLVYAQPLVVTAVQVKGATHDLLVVATMHNSVYAFDATSGDLLWERLAIGPSIPSAAIGKIEDGGKPQGESNTLVEVGILSTPVIDREKGYIYLARADYTNATVSVKVHVLDLATGADESGSPVTVEATAQGASTTIAFNPMHESQRPGLLLFNGTVYIGFASYQDWFPFHGWILGYTYSGGALKLTQTFNSTRGSLGGGFWNSGQGLLSDGKSIYGLTGNAVFGTVVNADPPNYGETFLKLSPSLEVEDWFTPYNYDYLNRGDYDVGAGGPVLIPGTSPQLITGGGKQGILYLLDTTNMGHVGADADTVTQEFQAVPVTHSIYGGPVLWTGNGAPRLYIWGTGDVMRAYELANGLFNQNPVAMGPVPTWTHEFADPSGVLSVSSNGSKAGTGIVWAVKPLANPNKLTVEGQLFAFDAMTLTQLWTSTDDISTGGFGNYAKFVPPTVANGRVYLATHSKSVVVYGLRAK